MNASDVLATLKRKGKPGTAKIYARHGVEEPCFGVSYVGAKSGAAKVKKARGAGFTR